MSREASVLSIAPPYTLAGHFPRQANANPLLRLPEPLGWAALRNESG